MIKKILLSITLIGTLSAAQTHEENERSVTESHGQIRTVITGTNLTAFQFDEWVALKIDECSPMGHTRAMPPLLIENDEILIGVATNSRLKGALSQSSSEFLELVKRIDMSATIYNYSPS